MNTEPLCRHLLWLALTLTPAAAIGSDVDSKTSGGIVQIYTLQKKGVGSGTGFVLNEGGYIATNNHVIDGAKSIYANLDGQSINLKDALTHPNAEVIWRNAALDLAIVRIPPSPQLHALTLASVTPKKGDTVFAIGYPGAADQNEYGGLDITSNSTFTKGVLSRSFNGSWGAERAPLEVLQHSAEVSWGNSGGPLVDECSRVIGVNTQISLKGKAFIDTKDKTIQIRAQAPGVYFASHIKELTEQLDNRGIVHNISSDVCLPTEEVLQQTQERFQSILLTTVIVGLFGFLGLASFIFIYLRKHPASPVAHALNNVSRRLSSRRHESPAHPGAQQPARHAPPNIILDGLDSETGQRYRVVIDSTLLAGGAVLVGREPNRVQVTIDHVEVSRVHLALRWTGDELQVIDQGSTNGTFINGKRVSTSSPSNIQNGDQLKLGALDLRVIGSQ